MADIRFDGKVAIVTGSGGGLGRQHALELARRGAKLVINDLGGAVDGSGGSSEAAAKVVEEIKALGGEALANGSSVTDDAGVALMVKQAMDAWGRVDILVANAGVLRDKSFSKMEIADFEFVLNVHLMGTVKPVKALWETMREQNYGRIPSPSPPRPPGSTATSGQTNYGARQAGAGRLHEQPQARGPEEQRPRQRHPQPPVAATPDDREHPAAARSPTWPRPDAYVTPGVVYLCSEEAPTGAILTAGAGAFALARIYETEGVYLGEQAGLRSRKVRDNWATRSPTPPASRPTVNGGEQTQKFFRKMRPFGASGKSTWVLTAWLPGARARTAKTEIHADPAHLADGRQSAYASMVGSFPCRTGSNEFTWVGKALTAWTSTSCA